MPSSHVKTLTQWTVRLALGFSWVGCASGAGPQLETATTKAAVAPVSPVELPHGVEPLPNAFEKDFERLLAETESHRGLAAGASVPRGAQSPEALFVRLGEMLDTELPDSLLAPAERALQLFRLVPETIDLKSYYQELLSTQVGGYFDPETGFLVIVETEGGLLGEAGSAELGEETARRLEESVLVHEINHYLQDYHFDLEALTHTDELVSDRAVAVASLVEGDATLVMYSYLLDMQIERFPLFESLVDQMLADPAALTASPDLPGAEQLASAPAYVRENLVFPYLRGFVFCSRVRQAGGQKLLDYAFSTDPPRSTEQILHPDLWLGPRDEPIEIDVESIELPEGVALWTSGTWGELNLRLILDEHQLGDVERSRQAAAGWGGDRFGLWRRGDQEWLGWVSEWDTVQDADEFEAAAHQALTEWSTVRPSPTRVVSVWPAIDSSSAPGRSPVSQTLSEQLQGASLSQRAGVAPDLATIGVLEDDVPPPFAAEELTGLLENPVLAGLAGFAGEDSDSLPADIDADALREMLETPAMRQAVAQAVEAAGFDASQLDQLLKDPSMVAMLGSMRASAPPQATVANGRFELPDVGFSLDLPTGEHWADAAAEVEESLADTTLAPDPSLVWAHFEAGATLAVVTLELPMAAPIEAVVTGFEAGQQSPDFRKLRGEYIEVNGHRAYDLEFESVAGDVPVYSLQRVFLLGSRLIAVQAFMPLAAREEVEQQLRQSIDSIRLGLQ